MYLAKFSRVNPFTIFETKLKKKTSRAKARLRSELRAHLGKISRANPVTIWVFPHGSARNSNGHVFQAVRSLGVSSWLREIVMDMFSGRCAPWVFLQLCEK